MNHEDDNEGRRRTADGREVLMGPGPDEADGPTILLDDTHASSSPTTEVNEDIVETLSLEHEDYGRVMSRAGQRFNAGRGIGSISQVKATAASMGLSMGPPAGFLPARIPPTSIHV